MLKLAAIPVSGSIPVITSLFVTAATAYSQTPEDLFPGMSSDGTDLTIPIASMADYGLLAAHCVASTGNAKQLSYALSARIFDWCNSLPTAEKPVAMTVGNSRSSALGVGTFASYPKDTFNLGFYIDWPDEVVVDEP